MAIAYRRFADELVARNYAQARRLIKTVDPNHPVSFRMTETSNPTDDSVGTLSFDFAGVAPAVDFLEPEGYGRIGGPLKPARLYLLRATNPAVAFRRQKVHCGRHTGKIE